MGIFEKAIPKYTYNMANEVVVTPQDVYVDDIFDPIFNARVKEAMREKYGDGLYGIVGGYEELLKNTWTGDHGILGPGMGVLSTFGRSMEKADDIVLGALTEGIKGLSGQGAVDPIENIFVNDHDYTGRGLLAATTNIGRGLVGGTTVDESDFNGAWTIPALGLELGTDVGILGGTLSRKLAPGASKLTSKELFENLGKSDLKTSIGEIGQLMSNYDDLMAKVAIDVSAPGLRPAFKSLMNRIAEIIPHNAAAEYADVRKLMQDPELRKQAKEHYDKDAMYQMLLRLTEQSKSLPADVVTDSAPKTINDVVAEVGEDAPLNKMLYIKDLLESDAYRQINDELDTELSNVAVQIRSKDEAWQRGFNKKARNFYERLTKKVGPVQIGTDQFDTTYADKIGSLDEAIRTTKEIDVDQLRDGIAFLEEEYFRTGLKKYALQAEYARDTVSYVEKVRGELDELRQIVRDAAGVFKTPSQKFKTPAFHTWFSSTYPDFDTLSKADQHRILTDIRKASPVLRKETQELYDSLFKKDGIGAVSGGAKAESVLNTKLAKESPNRVNLTYVGEVLEKLEDDEKLLEALTTGEWSSNEATNNAINAALGNPSYKERVWYSKANAKFRSSPSRLSKLQAYGTEGTSYAYARLDAIRYAFRNPNDVRFKTEAELDAYLNSDKMFTAFIEFFPIDLSAITRRAKAAGKDVATAKDKYLVSKYAKFKKAVKDVYFPKPKKGYSTVSVGDYTKNLEILSAILDGSKMRSMSDDVLSKVPHESMFLEDLYRVFDDVREDGTMRGVDQVYLQPLRNEVRSSKSSTRMASTRVRSYQEPTFDDSTGQKVKQQAQDVYDPDKNVGLADDYSTSVVRYVQSTLSQYAHKIKSDEDLQYIIEPLLDYMQFTPSTTIGKIDETAAYLSRATGLPQKEFTQNPELRKLLNEELGKNRLNVSANTKNVVSEFKQNVLPKLQTYTQMGINPLDGRKPPKVSRDDFNEARALLGFNVKDADGNLLEKHANGYANRLMFQSIWDPHLPQHRWTGPYGAEGWKLDLRSEYSLDYVLEDAAMRANLSQAKFELPEFTPSDTVGHIFDFYRTKMDNFEVKPNVAKQTTNVENVFAEAAVKAAPEEAAKLAYEPPSFIETDVEDVLKEVLGEEAFKFYKEGGSEDAFKALNGEHAWSLKEQIAKAANVPSRNSFRTERATLRRKSTQDALHRITSWTTSFKQNGGKYSDFRRFYVLRQQPYGDVLDGKNFWNELRQSGMFGAVYSSNSKTANAVIDSLTKNANLLNEAAKHKIVSVYADTLPDGRVKVYAQLNNDKRVVKWINDAADAIEKQPYESVVFSPPTALSAEELAFMNSPEMRELADLMDEAQHLAEEQASWLGFKFDNTSPYTKHAMLRTPDTATWFNENFYTHMASEDLDAAVNSISNLERYRKADHGAFGTLVNTRRFRGDTWMMDDANKYRFNYDPYEVVTSTLADGAFANLQFQSYVDLLFNDDFKIKGVFNSVDELKELLHKPLANGKPSANLRNLELCSARTDASGKIIGLTKYDKLSDTGLAKALADPNTVLVPTTSVSHMDNLLRKDVRMSNRFWTFVQTNFTIPFKFGVLSNPGFLLGNMSDSYLKLATTMSQKYGTTVHEEAARVAGCLKRAQAYKEEYYRVFDAWREIAKAYKIELTADAQVPDIVSMSPKYNERVMDWLSGRLVVSTKTQDITGKEISVDTVVPCELPDYSKNAASTWITLQSAQMNSSKLREFEDLADLHHASEFDMPSSLWQRVTQGKSKYDAKRPSTWGLFMNNPVMVAMLKKSSGWEDVIRTASILDDLEHGYTLEELGVLTRSAKGSTSHVDLKVRLDEAKNAMYNAQFDYERGSDFIEGVGKVVPFPIFFLKNFAYWMELFINNPQYVDNAIDIQEGLWATRDEEHSKDTFAVEAKGRGAIPVGGDSLPDWFKGFYKPSPLQSMFGAFSLLNTPVDDMRYRVNPLISGGIAATAKVAPNELTTYLAKDTDTKYRPYSTNMYERNIKSSDPNFNPLEYAVHRANPYERAVNTALRTPQKIKKGDAQLSDFVPSVFQPEF